MECDLYYPIDQIQLDIYIDNQANIFQKIWSYIIWDNVNISNELYYDMSQNITSIEILETFRIDGFLYEYNFELLNIKSIINENYIYYLNVSFYTILYIFLQIFLIN